MVGKTIFTDAFFAELRSPEKDYGRIKSLIIEAYNRETGKSFILDSVTQTEQKEFIRWMNQALLNNTHAKELSYKEKIVLVPNVSVSLSHKINAISQFHCPLCDDGRSSPIQVINIRISPVSKQAISKDPQRKNAFEKAIKYRLGYDSPPYKKGSKLCVHVLFVLGRNCRDKDLDNMSKALLDGLKGGLFHDDIEIEHLSSLKFNWDGEDDFVTVNIRISNLSANDNIIIPTMAHSWAGAEFLNLDEFIA